jgi:predicted Zn finger-like uncharacterized protein
MHVNCPRCTTVFNLQPAQLAQASGRVRCGCCGNVFDANLARVPMPIAHGPRTARQVPAAPRPAPERPLRPEEVFELSGELDGSSAPPSRRRASLLTMLALLALLGLFGWQLFLGLRTPLLAAPEWRPWLDRACGWIDCTLPPLRDPGRIEIMARDIRAHPRYSNGLLVDLTIVNRAAYSQPFPVLQLTFTSLDEQWFAQRRFQPGEYLGANQGNAERLPPDIPVQVVLELLDPGPDAVNFSFSFL